ncbi:hypothetical protein EJB05_33976, partial [Eragrostis curvula]
MPGAVVQLQLWLWLWRPCTGAWRYDPTIACWQLVTRRAPSQDLVPIAVEASRAKHLAGKIQTDFGDEAQADWFRHQSFTMTLRCNPQANELAAFSTDENESRKQNYLSFAELDVDVDASAMAVAAAYGRGGAALRRGGEEGAHRMRRGTALRRQGRRPSTGGHAE